MQGSPQTPSPSSLSPSPSTSSCAQVIARRSSGQFCVVLDLISYAWANRARLRAGSKESEDLARMMLMLDRKTFNMQNKASPSPNLAPTFDSGSPGPASRPGEKEGSEYFGCRDLAINRKRKRRCANSLGGFAKQTPPRCQTVFKHPELSIMIFRLPVGSRIPIHDHEGMTVLSHLLYGRMISTEYDWVDKKKGVARLDFNGVLEAGKCDVHVVGENYRNCHSFQALSECAVLDIITPSYSKESPPKFFLAKPLRLDKTDKGGHTEGNAQTKLHHEFVGKKKNQSKHAQELGKLFTLKEYFPTDFSCCEEQYLGPVIRLTDILRYKNQGEFCSNASRENKTVHNQPKSRDSSQEESQGQRLGSGSDGDTEDFKGQDTNFDKHIGMDTGHRPRERGKLKTREASPSASLVRSLA